MRYSRYCLAWRACILLTLPATHANIDQDYLPLATGVFENTVFKSRKQSLRYQILIPEQARTQRLPLLIYLHGAGQRGTTSPEPLRNNPVSRAPADTFTTHPCILIAPICPKDEWWDGSNLECIEDLVDELTDKLPIDDGRIYVTGVSMGGMGTWALVARNPRDYAAAITICGGGNPKYARVLKDLPIWAFHGDADPIVPVESTRDMIQAIKAKGGQPKYTEYPGAKHGIAAQTYGNPEVWNWLFEQER